MSERDCHVTSYTESTAEGELVLCIVNCACGEAFRGTSYADIKTRLCDHFGVESFDDPMNLRKKTEHA